MRLARFVHLIWLYSRLRGFYTGTSRPSFRHLWWKSHRPQNVPPPPVVPLKIVVPPGSDLERAIAMIYAGASLAEVHTTFPSLRPN